MRPVAVRTLLIHTVNVMLTVYLVGVRKMGAVGAALATFLVVTLMYPFLNLPLGWRLANVRPRQWLRETFWPGIAPSVGAIPIWIVLAQLAPPRSWGSLAACVLAGYLCYFTVLLCFCLRATDRGDLAVAIQSVRRLVRSRRQW